MALLKEGRTLPRRPEELLRGLEMEDDGHRAEPPNDSPCLDAHQLARLEQSFRAWAGEPRRPAARASRQRLLLIFLLIRYAGAKLSEALAFAPSQDLDLAEQVVRLGRAGAGPRGPREVPVPAPLARELQEMLARPPMPEAAPRRLAVDPGFVRRKFYERAEACGFPKRLGAPELIRKARAVELIQNNLPLPAVQTLMGHSTPSLTAAGVSFSAAEIRQVTRHYLDREATRKTSARNTFIGKVEAIERGDIQSRVTLVTMGSSRVAAVITNDSLVRLGLRPGRLITAEVKAPWLLLQQGGEEPRSTADNRFSGTVVRILSGQATTEVVVRTDEGTELCAVVTSESARQLGLQEQDPAWVLFNGYSVVLHEGG
ncbi:MAG: TOBE domain-containing protein [Thermodesulfobacteriota bacterium]